MAKNSLRNRSVWVPILNECLSKIIHFRCNFSVKNKPSILGSPIMIHSIYDILCNMKIEYVYINTYLYMCFLFLRQPANHKSKPFSQKNPSPFKNILTRKLPRTSYPLQDLGPSLPQKKGRNGSYQPRTQDSKDQVTDLFPFDRSFILESFFGPRLDRSIGKVLWFVGWLVEGSPSPEKVFGIP